MAWGDPLDEHVRAGLTQLDAAPSSDDAELAWLADVFAAQVASRHVDLAARWLRETGHGFYTIASAGHESNAIVAAALRPTDPALLHYRSGAFYVARAAQVPGQDPVRDILLGVVASSEDQISGGRHKVFGSRALSVIPQTSTIASHLPRAVGLAFALERAAELGVMTPWPADAVVVCSLGDASLNHSTAVGALNAAGWIAHQQQPLPLLVVCEDNGIGISVRTPAGWVESASGSLPGVRRFAADGADPVGVWCAATEAAEHVRLTRRPAFLHLRTVRFLGHAGADVESAYRSPSELQADLGRDPILATARAMRATGVAAEDLLRQYDECGDEVRRVAAQVAAAPRLRTTAQVVASLAPDSPEQVRRIATSPAAPNAREEVFGRRLPEDEGDLTLAQAINRALLDLSAAEPGLLVFGEDVARKGGVYGVTRGLQSRLGPVRVFDTLLDEQTVLGLALGAGLAGLLPVPEIQYLAYLHNAEDQLRGEAASLSFFSSGRFRNPMVVRVAGLGYQKGFGGHFHNDNAVGVLRDIPGLVVACPSRADDAAPMLRTCVAAARADGRVCVFLEPIALYHSRDLHAEGDGEWLAPYSPPAQWADSHVPIGRARTYGDGIDLTVVTFGNGVPMSLRVGRRLAESGVCVRVVDLRWLVPLPCDDLLREARATGRVLVVDETRRTGGVSEGVVTALVDGGFAGPVARVTSVDSYIPLGDAAELVLLSEAQIEAAARALLDRPTPGF